MHNHKLFLFATALCLLLAHAGYAQRGDWFNDPDEYAFAGAGTAASPYLINSVTDLVHLAERVNRWQGEDFAGRHFLLTSDINLGRHYWIPIGSERENPFRGIFNGNGRIIRNLHIGEAGSGNVFEACGLFGYVGEGARIINLSIVGGHILGGGRDLTTRAGALAGLLTCNAADGREDSIIIRNCRNIGVHISGGKADISVAGGLIGEAYSYCRGSGAAIILVENCANNSFVTGGTARYSFAGGIMGKGRGHGQGSSRMAAIALCLIYADRNAGAVQGGSATGREAISAAGGILGHGQGAAEGPTASEGLCAIRYCINTAGISGGDAPSPFAQSCAGGLLGYADGYGSGERSSSAAVGSFMMQMSANRGQVSGSRAVQQTAQSSVGGLLGFAAASVFASEGSSGGDIACEGRFSLENCYSYAAVSARRGMAGGLAGCVATRGNGSNRRASAVLRNSFAAGTINRGDSVYPVSAGGIVGSIRKGRAAGTAPVVSNCLAALSYLNGAPGRTFRIAGQLSGLSEPYTQALSNNYAYAGSGRWGKESSKRNGLDWDLSLLSPPFTEWDFRNRTWLADADRMSLPTLNRLPNQVKMPVPNN
ncbi:MAG: hypothetical protein LBD21_08080 [Tannerellaceae bacterium]|jgi:hypothetical protein|nr:hypothetical protein [Tannerellaceae bacterium]